jgi:hypothetical protein
MLPHPMTPQLQRATVALWGLWVAPNGQGGHQDVIGIESNHVIPETGDYVLAIGKKTNLVIVRLRRRPNVNPKPAVGIWSNHGFLHLKAKLTG